MLRRTFLTISALAVGVAASARLIFCEGDTKVDIAVAWRRAKERGRPLLVIVTSSGREKYEEWGRGTVIGSWIANASDEELLDLSLVDVVCAPLAEVKALGGKSVGPDSWLVLLSPENEPPAVSVLDGPFEPLGGFRDNPLENEKYEDWQKRLATAIRERSAKLASFVHDHVMGDAANDRLSILAGLANAGLTGGERESVDRDDLQKLDAAIVERGAAPLLVRARNADKKTAAAIRAALVASARARLIDKPPAGAAWATSDGCGTWIDGRDDGLGVACGMGHVPALERRFLYFLTLDAK